jgi:hypothetical protein
MNNVDAPANEHQITALSWKSFHLLNNGKRTFLSTSSRAVKL